MKALIYATVMCLAGVSYADVCSPTYNVQLGSCVTEASPTQIQNVETDWILVNKGARRITDGLCTEYITTLQNDNPQASNIRFKDLEDRDATFRGLGKRDVYCKFTMDKPVKLPVESAECGILGVQRQGCVDNLSMDFVRQCLESSGQTDVELWKKGACLADIFRAAPHISGMDQTTYDKIIFQMDMMRKSLANSKNPNERHLSEYLSSHD